VKLRWSQLGGRLGVGFVVAGFILIFLGWNGAASWASVAGQMPYVISGGVAGLSLVVIGVGLMVIENQRVDRVQLQHTLAEVRDLIERMAGSAGTGTSAQAMAEAEAAGLFVAGPTTYHRPTCPLLEGRGVLSTITKDDAEAQGLTPCRVCDPDAAPAAAARPRRRKTAARAR
jgi:hypothetical protein